MSTRKDALKQNNQKDRGLMKSLIQNVRNHWPDQTISEEHLQNPTTDFVKTFYSRIHSEYEAITNNIKNNIMEQEEKSDQSTYNDEISLVIKLKRLCRLLGFTLILNDICEPQPRRTLTYFSILMNALIFLKSRTEYMDEIEECVEKKKHLEKLKETKTVFLQEIGDSNEMHVRLENSITDLNQDIQNLTKEHENIMMQKAEKDFKYQQDIRAINKLKEDIKASDEHLDKLRKESAFLLEQIVCEHEVEKLKDEIDDLRKQFNNLDVDRTNVIASLKVQEEETNFYNKCLAVVENSLFSSENMDSLRLQIEKLNTLTQQVNNKFEKTINCKRVELKNLKEEYIDSSNSLQKLQKEFENLNCDYEKESVKLKDDLNMLILKIKEDKKTFRLHEEENKNFEDDISQIKNDLASVKSYFSAKYKELMRNQNKAVERFHQALLNIKGSSSSESNNLKIT